MSESSFERGEPTMVEAPEGIPDVVLQAIQDIHPDKITSTRVVERDESGKVRTIAVRRMGMITHKDGQGSTDPTYNTTTEYTVEYKGDTPRRLVARTEFDGPAGENARQDPSRGESPNEVIEL